MVSDKRLTGVRMPSGVLWPALALLAIAIIAALLPKQALQSLNLVGYAVCHRIPDRSFFIASTQLPLCARDTGMFSATLIGMLSYIVLSCERFSQFPRWPYTLVLIAFFLAWGFDGFNSYMLLLRGEVFIYMPQNWLRLVTGAFMGVTLSAFVVALFNSAVWTPGMVSNQQTVRSWRDIVRLAVVAISVIIVVLWQPDFLYGPIALISTLGVITLLVIVNSLLVVLLMKRESKIEQWRQLILPFVAGVFFTFTEIMLIDIVRSALTQQLGLLY